MRSRTFSFSRAVALLAVVTITMSLTSFASAEDHAGSRLGDHAFETPVFGLSNGPARHGVLVADAGAGGLAGELGPGTVEQREYLLHLVPGDAGAVVPNVERDPVFSGRPACVYSFAD